jgi:hypothetical protein
MEASVGTQGYNVDEEARTSQSTALACDACVNLIAATAAHRMSIILRPRIEDIRQE